MTRPLLGVSRASHTGARRRVRTVVGDVCACEPADDGKRLAVGPALGEHRVPLLRSERGWRLHDSRHGDQREACIRALV